MTERERLMRDALAELREADEPWLRRWSSKVLAAVDALPEEKPGRILSRPREHALRVRAEAAEARLAQIAELLTQADSYCSRPNTCGLDIDAARRVARGGDT